MTTLRKVYRGQPVDLVAVDALADHYDALLADLKIQPPVRSQRCEIEHLDRLFAPADFDLVYMRFALDHCYDPLLALRQMVRVTRPGGAVVVEHYRDAAQTDHQGLRQWDLVPSDDDLVVRNTTAAFSVAEEFPDLEHSVTYSATWLTLVLRL
jgi:ubiquinone/menaquinone biosynthesis C-methylase UbiE